MTRVVSTKRLSSGKYINLAELTTSDVDIKDINRALNYIYRFTGHWKDQEPLTVAQHLKLAKHLATIVFPNDVLVEFDTAIHDYAEAYTGDIATPLKYLFGTQFKDYENDIEDTVYDALYVPVTGIKLTTDIYEQRKVCDLLALDIERRAIWKDQNGKDHWPDIPMDTLLSLKEKTALFNWAKEDRLVDLEAMYIDVSKKVRNEFNTK